MSDGNDKRKQSATLEKKNQQLEQCVQEERQERVETQMAMATLQESEELHRLIFENVRDFAIFFADLEGRIVRWNPGAERFFGYAESEILGQPMEVLYTPEDRAKGIAALERSTAAKTGHSSDERWHVRKDGSHFFLFGMVNALHDDAGQLRGFVKIARDVTERKRFQDRLRHSEELHRLIIENIHDFAIFTCDFDGKIETWNPGAERIFGYGEEEIKGQTMAILFAEEDRASGMPEKEQAEAIKSGSASRDGWYVRKDGRRIFLTGAVQPIQDERGNLRGFAKVARDITARRELEEQLHQARNDLETLVSQRTEQLEQTVAELKAFSYSLSHDMRAPVRAIRSFCELAAQELGETACPRASAYLEQASRAAQRLDTLIQDVLALSHLSLNGFKRHVVDIQKLIQEIIRERPELQEPKAEIILVTPLPPVLGHEACLTQCVTNLLENAVKFVSPGVKPRVRICTEIVGDQVRLWFEDNGIGMDTEAQHRLFQMFTRVHSDNHHYAGTGIGLTIARKAVERMGGEIGVESRPGQGSRFWVKLPRPAI